MIQAGDLVRLKSGGPIMTVGWMRDEKISCEWFDERNELKSSIFRYQQLELVVDKHT
ncbi:DUF2158 domain-containing protein [Porphyrobacter sp. SLTP]|uniref:DUF2158 domain-containing protein n=1 Tax=Porphyrobacter sp. SLTP TaxID=2683266 RepID=UPI001412D4B9|nr:DUF2158 domain-containing protein [Porphyrobacter sp. SLTP]